jgi:hypothetical protein
MVVGSIYSSMSTFRLAMSRHEIKHQFEFNIAKSGPQRFRTYCSSRDLGVHGDYTHLPVRAVPL